jgi:hypothetical protein
MAALVAESGYGLRELPFLTPSGHKEENFWGKFCWLETREGGSASPKTIPKGSPKTQISGAKAAIFQPTR